MRYCTKCGKELLPGNSFCVNCGLKTESAENEYNIGATSIKPSRKEDGKAKTNWFAYLFMVVLAIVFIVFGTNLMQSSPIAKCGNGTVEAGEACDDNNLTDGDGCSSTCHIQPIEPVCGNGKIEEGEECDDGNVVGGDGCSSLCKIDFKISKCGNKIQEFPELCDDGNLINGDGCSSDCKAEDRCPDRLTALALIKNNIKLYDLYGEFDPDLGIGLNNIKVYGIIKNNSSKCYASFVEFSIVLIDKQKNVLQKESYVMLTKDKQAMEMIAPGETKEFIRVFKVYDSLITGDFTQHLSQDVADVRVSVVGFEWRTDTDFNSNVSPYLLSFRKEMIEKYQ